MVLDEERVQQRIEAVMELVIGLPIVEAVTVCVSAAGLALKAAGAELGPVLKHTNMLIQAIPIGHRLKTLVRG